MSVKRASFTARARVIDLLGREQIADAATAISELLKNAIDAQADNAIVNFFSESKYLLVEDSGLGMRKDDLLNKWLTIATESKQPGFTDDSYFEFASENQKVSFTNNKQLGEKGIGRLAVAALGSGVIVWTRWGKGDKKQCTMLLLHWGLFRHPRLSLDEILMPYIELPGNADKSHALSLIEDLKNWCTSESDLWNSPYEESIRDEIIDDLESSFLKFLDEDFEFKAETGTSFAILKTTPEVDVLFDFPQVGEDADKKNSENLKLLFGFCDPFNQEKKRLDLALKLNSKPVREIDFWKEDDLKNVDHKIEITINQNGYAEGYLRVFDEEHKYSFQLPELPLRHHQPGPIKLILGYVEGEKGTSKMNEEVFDEYTRRLDAFGALYVYRDGVKVLPYGSVDQDFLEFETRRSKNAGRHFFSHRRMLGAIYINSRDNVHLKDKAGREGFIRNGAYRGFVYWLKELFDDLAKTYYGSSAPRKDKEMKKEEKKKKKEDIAKERCKLAKKEFLRELGNSRRRLPVLENILDHDFSELECMISDLEEDLELFSADLLSECYEKISICENNINHALDELVFEISPIVVLNNKEKEVVDNYFSCRDMFQNNCNRTISTFQARLYGISKNYEEKNAKTKRLQADIDQRQVKLHKTLNSAKNNFDSCLLDISNNEVPIWLKEQKKQLAKILQDGLGEKTLEDIIADQTGKSLLELHKSFDKQNVMLREEFLPFWNLAEKQLKGISKGDIGEFAIGILNREFENMQEKFDIYSNYTQLGMMIESLDHEYNNLFDNIDNDFKKLPSDLTNSQVCKNLKHSFDSLKSKLGIFSPLYRRRNLKNENLLGEEIKKFIEAVFDEKKREGIEFSYTSRFLARTLKDINKPVVLAGIVNMVYNSLFWVKKTALPPEIRFSVIPHGVVISDSGPGITERDRENIFEAGFSRKPYGRGLGLYITKTNFEKSDLDLWVASEPCKGALRGANFVIKKRELVENV